MRIIKNFRLFESTNYNNLYDACENYLKGTSIWNGMKDRVSEINPELSIVEDPDMDIDTDAQFDYDGSSENKLVILINPEHPYNKEYKRNMAHELTHALQFVRDGYLDLFGTDATRDFKDLSPENEWEKLMMAIYLSDPIEVEATRSEVEKYGKNNFIEYMSQWMKEFDPVGSANRFKVFPPDLHNKFDITSFEEFPDLWASVYINYGVESPNKEIIDLKNKSLEDFLKYYDKRFKSYPI
jgi:hypothetical protein